MKFAIHWISPCLPSWRFQCRNYKREGEASTDQQLASVDTCHMDHVPVKRMTAGSDEISSTFQPLASPHSSNSFYDSIEQLLAEETSCPPSPPDPSIYVPQPILPPHTLQHITFPLPSLPTVAQRELNVATNTRTSKRRKIDSAQVPKLTPPTPTPLPAIPQYNPALTLELVGDHHPGTIPTVHVAHTVSVATLLVRVIGQDPLLEHPTYCNDFIVKSKFFQGNERVKIPGDGLVVSTFHMTKDTGGMNRNAFWTKQTRIAKFQMKIFFSPRSEEERRLSVKFQLCHQHAPGHFTAITSLVHLVDLYVIPASQRSSRKTKGSSSVLSSSI